MKCGRCQHEAPADAEFCPECGAGLRVTCGRCGTANAPGHKFCKKCGQALAAPSVPPPETPAPAPRPAYTPPHLAEKILSSRAALEGERKLLTVLFCDVVDSSALAGRLDPEQMHEVMDRALRLMAEAVHRYEGTVNQFLGDGLMALFGAPVALEDHALRAVQAALTIQETMAGYSEQIRRRHGTELRLRLGLNTGPVVVGRIGDDLRMDYTAVGETTHLAARMQSMADPGAIYVAEATHRLVDGYVRTEALGPLPVKGRGEPVKVFRVAGRRRPRTRLEVSAERGLTPLLGRERELGLLRDCLARARAGRGQIVGLVGEAGVGKSRLLHELRLGLAGERVTWLEGRCVPYGQDSPYLPVTEILRVNFHIEDDDHPLQIRQKIRQGVWAVDPALEGIVPYLGELFALPVEDGTVSSLDPRERRQKTFEAMRALTVAGCQRRPHVVVLEDLHWIDRTSEDYLAFLAEGVSAVPLVLVVTHRPGYPVRWADKASYTQIGIDLLGEGDTEAMLAAVLGTRDLPPALVRLVNARAEGNPLFVEEISRSLLERGVLAQGAGAAGWTEAALAEIPATAQDIIRARIDHLEEPVKRALQLAAVIGRDFGAALLARVSEAPEAVPRCLAAMTRLELVTETRVFPEPEYRFRHNLVREVVYETLLRERRRLLHGLIGVAMEHLYAERLGEHYDMLAYHFVRADDTPRALDYLLKAGDKAAGAFANREAIAFYEQALDVLGGDEVAGRADLFRKLSSVTVAVGEADASLRHAESALDLYRRLDDKSGVLAMHLHLGVLYGWHWDGALEYKAQKHLQEAAALVEHDPDSVEKGLIYQRNAHMALHSCQPLASRDWAAKAVDIFARVGVPMGTSLGTALSYTGQVDEGVAYAERQWGPGLKAGNPLAISMIGHELTLTLALLRDVPRARAWGERVLPEVLRLKSPFYEGFLRRPLSLVYALSGETAKAEEACEAVLRIHGETLLGCLFEDVLGVGLHRLRLGDWERARDYLERTAAILKDRHQVTALAACTLGLGMLRLAEGDLPGAERLLGQSLDTCRSGSNVLVELWVLPVLAETHLAAGRLEEARADIAGAEALLTAGQDWCGLPAPVHLARGLLARADGRWDEAAASFEQAIALDRRYGLPWDEGRALREWAVADLARGSGGARDAARGRLGQALEIFRRVGARREAARVETALQ